MRPEKISILAELKKNLQESPYVFFTDFTGLNVENFSQLRERLGKINARAMVVKNNMLRIVLKDLNMPDCGSALQGPTAMVFGGDEATGVAGAIRGFAKEFKKLKVKAGVMDGAALTCEQVESLADLPSKDELRAQLLGLFMAAPSRFVRLMNTPASQLVQVLQAKSQKAAA
ncbi:MAG: 50S ribosomal protein L10 [Verrucomicrobiae bacterium]|nr:50S ribosomal protein L10 [Verrucomicrobiae bacterium]